MRLLLLLLLAALLVAAVVAALWGSQGSPGRLTAWELQHRMGIGVDVDWVNYPRIRSLYMEWRSRGVNIPALFRQQGFTTARIRVSGDVTRDPRLLHDLETVVNDTLRAGMVAVIAYTGGGVMEEPWNRSAWRSFIDWWRTVAETFRNYPPLLAYDLVIEPSGPLGCSPELLSRLYNETIEAIRSIDPTRVIIVAAPCRSSPFMLRDLRVRADNYTMGEWHIYASGPRPKPPYYNTSLIDSAIKAAKQWMNKTGAPTWVGAWRPERYPKQKWMHHRCWDGSLCPQTPPDTALKFTKEMATRLCAAGIPFAVNAGHHLLDYQRLQWYPTKRWIIDTIMAACRHRG